MYVDGYFLLVIYLLASSAALISVYSLWTLKKLEEFYKKRSTKKSVVISKIKQKPKSKGHWG